MTLQKRYERCLYEQSTRHQGRWYANRLSVVSLLLLLVFSLQGCDSTALKSPVHTHPSPSSPHLASTARIDAYLRQLVTKWTFERDSACGAAWKCFSTSIRFCR